MQPDPPVPPEPPGNHPPRALDSYWPAPAAPPRRQRPGRGRLAALARGGGSLVTLAALVVGWPALLIALVGWPLPEHWPSRGELLGWLSRPNLITVRGVLAAAACGLWLLWAATIAALLLDITARVRRIHPPRLRLASPIQALVAGLVGTSVVAVTGATARAASPPAAPAAAAAPTADPTEALNGARRDVARSAVEPRLVPAGSLTVVAQGRRYTVTVHRGDTLSAIARTWLGDPDRWPEIYRLNRGRHFPTVGGTLTNPNLIYPGWVLQLPDDAVPPADATPQPPHPGGAKPDRPPAGAPARSTAAPTPTAPATAPPAPADPSTRTPAAAPPAAPPDAPVPHRPDGGVELADRGWVALPVAAAVAAAAALLWIQRRRRYRPHPPIGARRTDPDLTPLPDPIAALHAAAPDQATCDNHAELPVEAREALIMTQPALGTHNSRPLRPADLPRLGVGLVGPGADYAARGILAALLAAGGPWASDQPVVITTRPDLARLLGPEAASLYASDWLRIAATLDQALAELERHLLYRARTTAAHPDTDLVDLHPPGADQPAPPVVLLTQTTTDQATRLAAVLAVGARLAITGILLGAWPLGATWHIDADGTARPDLDDPFAAALRLNVLDAATTIDILDTLQQSRSGAPPPSPPPTQPDSTTTDGTSPPPDRSRNDLRSTRPEPAPPTAAPPAAAPQPAAATPRLQIHLLGELRIQRVDAGTATDIRIRRSDGLQILAYLAVHPDGATSDALMESLWPDVRRSSARGRFHTTISELRQTLHEAIAADAIIRTGDRYRLDPTHVDVDLWQFDHAVDHAATTVDPDTHTRALRDIIAGYTGHLADGHSWLWLAAHREAARRHVLDAYTSLAETEPDPRAALALIQQAIRLDPYSEDLYQRAMHLHAGLHSAEGVHRALRAITEHLAQLDIEPSPETTRLAAELLTKLDARRRHGHAA